MNLLWRRNYHLIIWGIVIFGLCLSLGSARIIAYNFGSGSKKLDVIGENHDNIIRLFDDSVMHEIKIAMAEGDYEKMITTYKETGEKDYFYADVTIDGVQMYNVGIRLKGNLTLRQAAGTNMGGGKGIDNQEKDVVVDEEVVDVTTVVDNQFPFLLKFDKFSDGQTYQGYTSIALRVGGGKGSDPTLLAEPVSYYLHSEAGDIVPESAYAYVKNTGQDSYLYVITENIDESFIERHFSNSDGVLYKAGNFVGFEYIGDDPTLYAEKFEQKSSNNNDDLYYLIKFLKFVTESTDEEFTNNLSKWLDINSFVTMMATDTLLGNNDSFVGMGSNYYLYYDKDSEKFTMLAWDMNLSMGTMSGGGNNRGNIPADNLDNMQPFGFEDIPDDRELPENFQPGDRIPRGELPEGIDLEQIKDMFAKNNIPIPEDGLLDNRAQRQMGGNIPGGRMNNNNLLKEGFFANEDFLNMYNEEITRLQDLFYKQGLALKKVEELAKVFTLFNAETYILDQNDYNTGVDQVKQFIEQQKTKDISQFVNN